MNRAQRALDLAQSRPADAVALAYEVLDDTALGVLERTQATWALGRAYAELEQIESAVSSLEAALDLARSARLDELGAEIALSLSGCRLTSGETSSARELLVAADPDITAPSSRGRLRMQQGLIELHTGTTGNRPLHSSNQAEPLLSAGVDDLARTRLLVNRGVVSSMVGDYTRAEVDFTEAQELAEKSGQDILSAGSAQNLGFVAGRKGDLQRALAWFTKARAAYEAAGSPQRVMGTLESDLCAVLLSGGLYSEAAQAARQAAAMAARGGNRLTEAEALLLLARVRLADGSYAEAEEHALAAAEIFAQSERQAWTAMADYIGLQAAAKQRNRPDEELWIRATEITEELLASGWVRDSLEVRTFAGRAALTLGHLDEARVQLTQAAETRHSGSSALRASAWLAAATLDLADGDRAGARQSLSTGMDIIEEHRSTLGSTELRAHASINGAELAELGLRLAAEDEDADEVLAWAERWHAGGFQLAPAKPDPDSRLAKAMVELRQAHATAIEGTADPFDTDGDDVVASLEREIRTLSREVEAASHSDDATSRLADINALRTRLAGGTLVEFFTIGERLHAVTVSKGKTSIQAIGPLEEIATRVRKLVAALGRLAFGTTNEAMAAATSRALEATAASLDRTLLGHLPADVDGELVIVPTGPLQSLAWPVLPSLADRTVTVTPSGGLWASTAGEQSDAADTGATTVARQGRPSERRRALLVCGSNLPGGETEIDRLRELYVEPNVLIGADATVAAVLAAMETADVVHVAAHGVFRIDNPMFSALELHDGPLTVYDLETLGAAPETVILPACDAARSSVRHGDELLGTASALLQVGVRSIVAPVTVVPDSTVVPALMVELHRQMIDGLAPAAALVEARRLMAADDRGSGMTAASFLVIGTATS